MLHLRWTPDLSVEEPTLEERLAQVERRLRELDRRGVSRSPVTIDKALADLGRAINAEACARR